MYLAINRLLHRRQQAEQQQAAVIEPHTSGLTAKKLAAGLRTLDLLQLSSSLDCLTRNDLFSFLYAVGMNPTPDMLDCKLRLLQRHRAARFTWGELAHVWSMLLHDAVNEDDILQRAFLFFDRDGSGEISVDEMRTTMKELGGLLSEEELEAFINLMDANNDGAIGYQEFLHVLHSTAMPQLDSARCTAEAVAAAAPSAPSVLPTGEQGCCCCCCCAGRSDGPPSCCCCCCGSQEAASSAHLPGGVGRMRSSATLQLAGEALSVTAGGGGAAAGSAHSA